jgi:signal transduction histidine kinase
MSSRYHQLVEKQLADFLLLDHKLAYAIIDPNLRVVEWNGEPQVFALQQPVALGHSLFELAPELVGMEQELKAILQGQSPLLRLPLINRGPSGEKILYLNLAILPFREPTGNITGLLYTAEDVTPLGVLEQTLVQQRNELALLSQHITESNQKLEIANQELRQLDEMKSRFISVAAHELRNPLASILGYLELLQDEGFSDLTPDQQQCLEVIQRSSQRLLSITNNLLDITRIEVGRIELDLQRINLLTLVENVATELQPRITAKKQTLFLDASPDLRMALCDETRSSQILTNLLSNAIKYTPEKGKITVRLSLAEDQQFIVLAVSDNGIGIAPEDQNKIFRSFFRGANVHLSGESGTGLGLNVTRSLAELQGGRIWFESQLNKGSTFYVTFPVDDMDDHVDPTSPTG